MTGRAAAALDRDLALGRLAHGGAPVAAGRQLLLLLLFLYAFYWVFSRFIGVIRWALNRIAYALGIILFSAAVVSGVFASAGLVAAAAIWTMGNINIASR